MQLEDLAAALQKAKLPERVQLCPGVVVTNPQKFITSHLTVLRAVQGKPEKQRRAKMNYYERLMKMYQILTHQTKN